MRKTILLSLLAASTLSLGMAQQTGGQTGGAGQTGGSTQTGGAEAGEPGVAGQSQADSALIVVETREPGSYVADREGVGLYTLVDEQTMEPLPCNAECLQAWPPYTHEGEITDTSTLNPELLGRTETEDGQSQVTYNGYPLYYYGEDRNPGVLTGQALEGFGGVWYVVSGDEPYEPLQSDPIGTGQ